jgi:hypothetical protein
MTTLALGGPGVACSVTRLRRLAAGELSGDERARAEAHLAGCARCQQAAAGLEAERRTLAAELPFDAFAAGVAEKLARAQVRPPGPAWRRVVPLALAAGLVVAVAAPLLSTLNQDRPLTGSDDGTRIKGGAYVQLLVREGTGARLLQPGEPIPPGAALRLTLFPARRSYVAVALVDEDGPALLHAGPASPGPLAEPFEWTGRRGRLVVVLGDRPVDGASLLRGLVAGDPAPAGPASSVDVLVLPLVRGPR